MTPSPGWITGSKLDKWMVALLLPCLGFWITCLAVTWGKADNGYSPSCAHLKMPVPCRNSLGSNIPYLLQENINFLGGSVWFVVCATKTDPNRVHDKVQRLGQIEQDDGAPPIAFSGEQAGSICCKSMKMLIPLASGSFYAP